VGEQPGEHVYLRYSAVAKGASASCRVPERQGPRRHGIVNRACNKNEACSKRIPMSIKRILPSNGRQGGQERRV